MTEPGYISSTAYLAEAGQQIGVMIELVEGDAPCLEVIRAGQSARRALNRAGLWPYSALICNGV